MLALLLSLFANPLSPQTPARLLGEDAPIPGVGRVERITRAAVLEDGSWMAQVLTDHPTSTRDGVTVRGSIPVLREGEPLPAPSGARIRAFGGWDVNAEGELLWELTLTGPGIALGNRQALYWNARLLARESREVLLAEGSTGWTWRRFGSRRFGPDDTLWITASVDTPDPATPVTLLARTVAPRDTKRRPFEPWVVPGTALPGIGVVRSVELSERSLACNRLGELLWSGQREAAAGEEGFIARGRTYPVALEGAPSPVEGRTYGSFVSHAVTLNDHGDHAFRCTLRSDPLSAADIASDELIVRNGTKLVQEGDRLASLGAVLDESAVRTLRLDPAGRLFWAARVRGVPHHRDEAFMRDHEVLVREGETRVQGELVIALARDDDAFALDPRGRFFVARVELQETGVALVGMDLGLVEPVPGCTRRDARLSVVGGSANVGGSLRLVLDGAQAIGARSLVAVSDTWRADAEGCGVPTSYGELLLGHPIVALRPGPSWIAGPVELDLALPSESGLIDTEWILQGVFSAPTGSRAEPLRLANGVRIELGPP